MILQNNPGQDGLVIIGYSLGASLALDFASRQSVRGLVIISPLTKLKFPYSSPILYIPKKVLPFVPHLRYNSDRRKDKSYKIIPSKGLDIIKEGNLRIAGRAKLIDCPIYSIQFEHDEIIADDSSDQLKAILCNAKTSVTKIKTGTRYHNIFDLPNSYGIREKIISFLDELNGTQMHV